ncbi:MAG: hypothetical protein OHK0039_45460 [Bacteroidia bacterium]
MPAHERPDDDYTAMFGQIKAGHKAPLHEIYRTYRRAFIEWAGASLGVPATEAGDIYQEVIIILYENIVAGKITHLRSHIRTYLFGIGRILAAQQRRKDSRLARLEDSGVADLTSGLDISHEIELSERQAEIRAALALLGDTCRELLTLFYYRQYATEAIMEHFGYKNPNVVKSQKARCMRSLRDKLLPQR